MLFMAVLISTSVSNAAEYFLSPGQDINEAVRKLKAGDILTLEDGVWYVDSAITVSIPGTSAAAPVVIRARNPGKAVLSLTWSKAATGNLEWISQGGGFYKSSEAFNRRAQGMGWYDTTYIPFFEDFEGTNSYGPYGLKHFRSRANRTDAGFVKDSSIATPPWGLHQDSSGYIWVHLPDGKDPNTTPVHIRAYGAGDHLFGKQYQRGLIKIFNTPFVTLDGLVFEGCPAYPVNFIPQEGARSPNGTVRNCIFRNSGGDGGCINPANNTLVEWCEMYTTGLSRYNSAIVAIKSSIWPLMKVTPADVAADLVVSRLPSRTAEAVTGVEIRYCYMHQCWDGEKIGTCNESSSHHNRYHDCFDNASELETLRYNNQKVRNVKWHHNFVSGRSNAYLAFQDQALGYTEVEGPMYVYRNVFRQSGDDWYAWTLLKSRSSYAHIYLYHNLFHSWNGSMVLRNSNAPLEHGEFVFVNNIIQMRSQRYGSLPVPGMESNMFYCSQLTDTAENYFTFLEGSNENKLLLVNPQHNATPEFDSIDYAIASQASPLIDRGKPLSIDALPDLQANATGAGPDIGPFEYGETMGPDWPRPARTVFSVVSYPTALRTPHPQSTARAPFATIVKTANGVNYILSNQTPIRQVVAYNLKGEAVWSVRPETEERMIPLPGAAAPGHYVLSGTAITGEVFNLRWMVMH